MGKDLIFTKSRVSTGKMAAESMSGYPVHDGLPEAAGCAAILGKAGLCEDYF